jgi:hypothetical protein
MNRYWIRIALGVLLVFGLGMSALAAARKGEAEVRGFLATASSRIPLRLASLKFRFDGRSLGDVTGVSVERAGPNDLGRIVLRVGLADPADPAEFANCNFTADDIRHLDSRTGFRCAEGSELNSAELVKMGEIILEPGAQSRPLYLPRAEVERWRQSDIRSLQASMNRDGSGGVQARGSFDVRSNLDRSQRGTFNLQADSQGAVISVRDDRGRSLVDFHADHNGVNLNIRDRQGRNLVKLLADSLGAALRVRNR